MCSEMGLCGLRCFVQLFPCTGGLTHWRGLKLGEGGEQTSIEVEVKGKAGWPVGKAGQVGFMAF